MFGKAGKLWKVWRSWRGVFKPPKAWRLQMPNSSTVTVDVKSAWASKINWTQIVSMAAAGLGIFGVDMDAETQAKFLALVIAGQGVVTWVLRTWFTKAVTPGSVPS